MSRRVTVNVELSYSYEVSVPNEEMDDLVGYCDFEDPVYQNLCREMNKENIDYDAHISCIRDNETDEEYYVY